METKTLEYTKVREVKSPTRAHPTDAGIDFFVPTSLTEDDMAPKYETTGCHPKTLVGPDGRICLWELNPGESILIPSGIKVKVPDGCALVFMNKSGIGSKKHFSTLACVVDCGYEGEVHINLINSGNTLQTINSGEKIIQGIILPINFASPVEVVDEKALYGDSQSARGEGGFGSSGTK